MKKHILLIIAFFSAHSLFAQTARQISGTVRDSTGNSVIAATIRLTSPADTLMTRSDIDGNFNFNNVKSSQFVINITSLGYRNFTKRFLYKDGASPIKLDLITLKSQSNVLNEVQVSATKGITVKEDTVEYRASDFPVRENSVAEDVIKKLPGVEVDKDGNVTTQGKSVTRIRVNGKDYFDGDLKTATQNLPAEIIEKIQIIDDYGDQAAITGIREGEADKIINIQISPDKNKGMIVNATAGGGSRDRYQLTGNGMFMNNDQQLSVLLNLNNTNASPFNFGGGGGRGFGGGGMRSGNFGGGGGSGGNNYGSGGSSGGITNTTGAGFNYRDELGKKISINGSYRFTVRNTDLSSNSFNSSAFKEAIIGTTSNSDTENDRDNHNFNFNFEYKIDSLNYLRISPYVSVANTTSGGTTRSNQTLNDDPSQTRINTSSTDSKSPFLSGNIIYNHRFRKTGRNLSFAGAVSHSDNTSYQEARDDFRFFNQLDPNVFSDSLSHRNVDVDNKSLSSNANITYSEPIGKFARLDFGYNYSRTSYDNSRITEVFNESGVPVMSPSLSNIFDYSFTTNRISLNYRYDKLRLYNFNIGLTAQPTLLDGFSETNNVSVHREGFNFFPTARFSYNFARTRSLSINYSGRSTEPSFSQIQPVTDVSDPQRPVVGNPDLKAAFTQSLDLRYNTTDPASGVFFNTGVSGNIINDRISRNVQNIQVPVEGQDSTFNNIQQTNYLNADGYYSTNAYYSLGKPFANRKYRVSLNGSLNFSNDITYTNNEKNTGKNWSLRQGLRVQINPNQNVELYPGINYSRTWLNYSLPISDDTKAETWSFELNGRLYFFKTFILGFDGSKTINKGYSSVGTNPFILNTYLEKQFFNKRGTLRLQTFDVFDQGAVVSRSQEGNSYTDSQNNRLTRYFMATFSFRLQKFPGGMQPNFQRNREMRGDGPPGERPSF